MKKKRLSLLIAAIMLFQLGVVSVLSAAANDDGSAQKTGGSPFWVPTNSEKVLRDVSIPDDPQQTLVMEAAKNEYESGQVVIKASDGDLTNVKVSVSDLTYTQGGASSFLSSII